MLKVCASALRPFLVHQRGLTRIEQTTPCALRHDAGMTEPEIGPRAMQTCPVCGTTNHSEFKSATPTAMA
jgi:hypothetical protein